MKFTVGDRIVVTKRVPYSTDTFIVDAKGLAGVVTGKDYVYHKIYVKFDMFPDGPSFRSWESELEHELLYNSPLYNELK